MRRPSWSASEGRALLTGIDPALKDAISLAMLTQAVDQGSEIAPPTDPELDSVRIPPPPPLPAVSDLDVDPPQNVGPVSTLGPPPRWVIDAIQYQSAGPLPLGYSNLKSSIQEVLANHDTLDTAQLLPAIDDILVQGTSNVGTRRPLSCLARREDAVDHAKSGERWNFLPRRQAHPGDG